jgi:predicted transcriptional regulator
MKTDRIVIARGNMISVGKLSTENNRMLLRSQGVSTISLLGLVFDGIIEFEKGKRRRDPKVFYKGMKPEIAS